MIELFNDDCIKKMDEFIKEGRHVDAIITSPPYNMCLRVHSGKYMSRWAWKNQETSFSAKYANYSDDLPMDKYFEFQDNFINKALQITDTLFYNIQMITGNKLALFQLVGKYSDKIKEVIIWDKCTAQPAMNAGTLNSQFEFIFVFSNNKPYNRSFETATFDRGTLSNVWQIKRERNEEHKAAFPKMLVKKILENFTKEGDTIMDPFMGSGTCGVVCKQMNRNFIGIELDKNYFNVCQDKINEVLL